MYTFFMRNSKIMPIFGLVLIITIGVFIFNKKDKEIISTQSGVMQNAETFPQIQREISTPQKAISTITATQVARHNARESCWSVINSNVYDLTSWIPNHPGGEQAILQLCGTDGSEKFNGQHGGSEKQAIILAGFKIGEAGI